MVYLCMGPLGNKSNYSDPYSKQLEVVLHKYPLGKPVMPRHARPRYKKGAGFGVQGSGFRVWGLGFRA